MFVCVCINVISKRWNGWINLKVHSRLAVKNTLHTYNAKNYKCNGIFFGNSKQTSKDNIVFTKKTMEKSFI